MKEKVKNTGRTLVPFYAFCESSKSPEERKLMGEYRIANNFLSLMFGCYLLVGSVGYFHNLLQTGSWNLKEQNKILIIQEREKENNLVRKIIEERGISVDVDSLLISGQRENLE